MPYHGLCPFAIPISLRLGVIDDLPHLFPLSIGQLYISRLPIFLQPLRFGGARDSNHALRGNPSKCNLRQRASSRCRKFLNFVDNCFVLVEVLALELRDYETISACFME